MTIRSLEQLERSGMSNEAKEIVRAAFGDIKKKRNKYGNTIVEIDGIKFRSKKEGRRYCELKLLMSCGDVKFFEMQVPYVISGKIKYLLDFKVYWKDGNITHEDVKGKRTALYKLKKSRMLEKYGIEITEL